MEIWRRLLNGVEPESSGLWKTEFYEASNLRCVPREANTGFQLVTMGQARFISPLLDRAVDLDEGDMMFFVRARGHEIGPRQTSQTHVDSSEAPSAIGNSRLPPLLGLITGGFRFRHPPNHPLLSSLPWCFVVRAKEIAASHGFSSAMHLLRVETRASSAPEATLRALLVELVFHYVYEHQARQSTDLNVWTELAGDQCVSRAITAVNSDVSRDWSVDELARESGLSSSAFKLHFKKLTGDTPGRYFARLRVQRALGYLRNSDQSLGEIAERVGYSDAFAFSKAFKRTYGYPPRDVRRVG